MTILKKIKRLLVADRYVEFPEKQKFLRFSFLVILILICIALVFYYIGVRKSSVVFSHFFYIPVILSSLWLRRRGVWISVILSLFLIITSHIFLGFAAETCNNYIRALMFIFISFFVSFLSEERERHNRELSALCSVCSAFNTSIDLNEKMHRAMEEIKRSLPVNGISIFILEADRLFHLRYSYGVIERYNIEMECPGNQKIMKRVAEESEFVIIEDLHRKKGEFDFLAKKRIGSTAYFPIISRGRKVIGIIQLVSPKPKIFSAEERNILELIGSRIGVAIESSMLYEDYKKSEEKYRSLFNSDPNPIFIIDSDNYKIIDLNTRALDCYGYTRAELQGAPFCDLGDRGDDEIRNTFSSLQEGKSVLLSRKKHYRKGKIPFYVNINISHARYSEGYAFIATTTDISEHVNRDAQLIQAAKMTTLGTMAAGMAHELNQPLNVIEVGSYYLVRRYIREEIDVDEEVKTVVQKIRDSVKRAAEIICHMRDFSRQSDIMGSEININDCIRDVFKMLGEQLRVHQIEVDLGLDEALPHIFANHNRMEQVFMNLITNAMDALDEREEREKNTDFEKNLAIRSYKEEGMLIVTVSDNGTGIAEENLDRIFEPFFTTKDVGKGTGLGISISYGIVRDYGGTIEVESKAGMGTTFILKFPAIIK